MPDEWIDLGSLTVEQYSDPDGRLRSSIVRLYSLILNALILLSSPSVVDLTLTQGCSAKQARNLLILFRNTCIDAAERMIGTGKGTRGVEIKRRATPRKQVSGTRQPEEARAGVGVTSERSSGRRL